MAGHQQCHLSSDAKTGGDQGDEDRHIRDKVWHGCYDSGGKTRPTDNDHHISLFQSFSDIDNFIADRIDDGAWICKYREKDKSLFLLQPYVLT